MQLYRFSPIKGEKQLREAVIYVADKTSELSRKVIGKSLPISSLTIFAHYPDEFEKLSDIVKILGNFLNENNGPRVALHEPIKAGGDTIAHLRIRKPDPYRTQVGCDDFDVPDYETFKSENLLKYPNNLRLIKREDYEMIEFFHPDFDVLAYVVSKQLYEKG